MCITGANSGIGFAAAELCLRAGASRVIVVGRNAGRVAAAVSQLGPKATGEVADVASFTSIDAFVERMRAAYPVSKANASPGRRIPASFSTTDRRLGRAPPSHCQVIDVLIANAGVINSPHSKTPEGFEVTFGTNVIGCAHLTYGLLPLVSASPTGRIVILSSFYVSSCTQRSISARLLDVGGVRETSTTLAHYNESKVLVTLWGQGESGKESYPPL